MALPCNRCQSRTIAWHHPGGAAVLALAFVFGGLPRVAKLTFALQANKLVKEPAKASQLACVSARRLDDRASCFRKSLKPRGWRALRRRRQVPFRRKIGRNLGRTIHHYYRLVAILTQGSQLPDAEKRAPDLPTPFSSHPAVWEVHPAHRDPGPARRRRRMRRMW